MIRDKECVSSITKVKKSPMAVFEMSRESNQGIYIYNKQELAGVMLTAEQYEQLLNQAFPMKETFEKIEVEELDRKIKNKIPMGSIISAKNLDESLASLGFISKRNTVEEYTYVEMMNEITETGKLSYLLRKKEDRRNIVAEVIGEQTNKVQRFDKLLVKKIHLRVE